MTPLQRYVAEEIATDHADGLLPRREALRRLGLLGFSATAATALLAACATGGDSDTSTTTAPAGSTEAGPPPGSDTQRSTEPITFAGPDGGQLQAAWADAGAARGGVLVIHENRGLNDHIRSVAGRFAGIGYSALAIDLLSGAGGTATFTDSAAATAALTKIPQEQLLANLRAGLDELERRVPGRKLGATGFCFGGGLTWLLLTTDTPNLAAATPFYGPFPDGGNISNPQTAVLGVYASKDARIDASRPAAEAALQRAGAPHEIYLAQDADHAFFNDTSQRYQPAAATEAWRRVQDWYGRYLA